MNFYYADTYKGKINDTGVSLRKGPGTNYDRIKTLSKDSEYNLVDNNLITDEGGCEKGWYKMENVEQNKEMITENVNNETNSANNELNSVNAETTHAETPENNNQPTEN